LFGTHRSSKGGQQSSRGDLETHRLMHLLPVEINLRRNFQNLVNILKIFMMKVLYLIVAKIFLKLILKNFIKIRI
jgi:hypothetical protein